MGEQLSLLKDPRVKRLTEKQEETLRGLCAGKMQKQIAGEMRVSLSTVGSHINGLRRKFGVRTVRELIALCAQGGAAGPEMARLRADVKSLEAWRAVMSREIEVACAERDRRAKECDELRRQLAEARTITRRA